MVIMASSLIKAINECRHIRPEELITDTIKAEEQEQGTEKTEGRENK